MIFGQTSKRIFLGVIVCSFLVPLATMFWNPQLGVLLLLIGIFVSRRCLAIMRGIQLEGTLRDQEEIATGRNLGRTIYVSLVDDHGAPLDAATARARLDAAEAQAEPRDTVVGVYRSLT